MNKGIALHIGLNAVDPKHYQGWGGTLNACEADANDMAALAQEQGFSSTKLLTKNATRDALLSGIGNAAQTLKSGDFFLLSYSGHGGQLPDLNDDEPDGQDETWCMYDGQLVDDELYSAWHAFAPGVRILLLSDSCHSGTVSKGIYYAAKTQTLSLSATGAPVYRYMPDEMALRAYLANKAFYDPILKRRDLSKTLSSVKASVLLISGCQDNQLSQDGTFNGLFTANLKNAWNGGTFAGSYRRFYNAIVKKMPPDQTPKLSLVGANNAHFIAEKPFTINPAKKNIA